MTGDRPAGARTSSSDPHVSVDFTIDSNALRGLEKGHLLQKFTRLVEQDRQNTATLIAYLAEIDRRKLYLEHAYPSMFAFCTERFRMSEAIAHKRIRGGRAASRFPAARGLRPMYRGPRPMARGPRRQVSSLNARVAGLHT